jgi:hypothetical protein
MFPIYSTLQMTAESNDFIPRPTKSVRSNWKPHNCLLSAGIIAVAVAMVFQGVVYIQDGVGATLPYFAVVVTKP